MAGTGVNGLIIFFFFFYFPIIKIWKNQACAEKKKSNAIGSRSVVQEQHFTELTNMCMHPTV